jgi:hypothetical protein
MAVAPAVAMRRALVVFLFAFAGCTHAPELIDEGTHRPGLAPVLDRPVRLALESRVEVDPRFDRRVAYALRSNPDVSLAAPWSPAFDYKVSLSIQRRAMSRGTNFLLCWPGFLIFAPAWHGLEWPYRVTTTAIITRADGTLLTAFRTSDLYTFRYTSNGYGIGAGLGWIPFLWTIPPFVTGITASFAPEDWVLHEEFLLRGSEEWAQRVADDVLSAIAKDPAPPRVESH